MTPPETKSTTLPAGATKTIAPRVSDNFGSAPAPTPKDPAASAILPHNAIENVPTETPTFLSGPRSQNDAYEWTQDNVVKPFDQAVGPYIEYRALLRQYKDGSKLAAAADDPNSPSHADGVRFMEAVKAIASGSVDKKIDSVKGDLAGTINGLKTTLAVLQTDPVANKERIELTKAALDDCKTRLGLLDKMEPIGDRFNGEPLQGPERMQVLLGLPPNLLDADMPIKDVEDTFANDIMQTAAHDARADLKAIAEAQAAPSLKPKANRKPH